MKLRISQKKLLDSLRFRVYRRALHPELFNIADQLKITNEDYDATLWICPAGHVISFFRNDSAISEVVASARSMLPTRSLIHDQAVRREKFFEHHTTDGLKYVSSLQVEHMSKRVMAATRQDFAKHAKRGKFVDFGPTCEKVLPGFSYYCYELLPKGVHLMIFHALEEISTLVKTQSIFEIE